MCRTSQKRSGGGCKDGFGRLEKVLMRIGFYGFVLIGAAGIFLQRPVFGMVYVAGAVAGLLWVVYGLLCRYCPYPYHYSDCLFFPYRWLAALKAPPAGRMGWLHQCGFTLVMLALLLVPQPWLMDDLQRLLLFWLLAGPTVAALPMYYCRRCRHRQCAFNRVGTDANRLGSNRIADRD